MKTAAKPEPTAVAERAPSTLPAEAAASRGVAQLFNFSSFADAWDAAEKICNTQMVPKGYQGKPAEIIACWQFGLELGLPPMQSLTAVAVINGRPSLYGDGFLAVIKSSPAFEDCVESFDAETQTATCVMRRKGKADVVRTFSIADAQKANLTGKDGPWKQYTSRMLQMRARGFAGRDQFADVLRGMMLAEEAGDIPIEREVGGEVVSRAPAAASRSEALLSKLRPESAAPSGKDTAAASAEQSATEPTPAEQISAPAPELPGVGSPPYTADQLIAKLRESKGLVTAVNEVLDLARGLPDEDRRRVKVEASRAIKGG